MAIYLGPLPYLFLVMKMVLRFESAVGIGNLGF
jgi:hypothetical protein